ncbi:phage antirepressor KilAC domain-containing protein [Pseudomonas sp. RIT-PI-AD]|uniref:phage antirepressor KilAC domain-containing protein n=1 Tax=Pseudomonas sp. RIT-PI-AD TaxID=3035294 RepID=UPI0021DB0D19|nr:phage antirepressor KilAC domain-containing protein [Pseudomonas sp. RIT-PI-AD]
MSQPSTLAAPVIGSREIAVLTGRRHGLVCRDIRALYALEKRAPLLGRLYRDGMRHRRTEYLLDRATLRLLLERFDDEKRIRVLGHCTARAEAGWPAPALRKAVPATPASPRADEFADAYMRLKGCLGIRQLCATLAADEADFRRFLLGEGVMHRVGDLLMPHPVQLRNGRMVIRTGLGPTGRAVFTQACFTPKGRLWVDGLWRSRQRALAA